ncbi:phage tail sheath family protein [Streptomyces tagetis]|uniref:Phage tail sheath family protein n=1 Tax=Streptomyces tagetis TaxID=2820809 RepID=A0A940XLA0_9ACTN|nr:phage tail sheath subtilisin-like domain-containing protein [Streptomyces sp. RG38]MBQ0826634.1 phage tail sheath family protein [Streptomyces sp. RG38]
MPEYLAPGVFVEEVSFRAKSIEGVPTSTTGLAGMTRYGPVHYQGGPLSTEPRLVTSFVEFERLYGKLEPLGDRVPYLAHAVRAFFLNGGQRLYVSRVYNPGDGTGVAKTDVVVNSPAGTASTVTWCARWPGSMGNVFVEVRPVRSRNVALPAPSGAPAALRANRVRNGSLVEVAPAGATLPDRKTPLDMDKLRTVEVDSAGRQTFHRANGDMDPLTATDQLVLVELEVTVLVDPDRTDRATGLGCHTDHRRWIGKILDLHDPEDDAAVVWLKADRPNPIGLAVALTNGTDTERNVRGRFELTGGLDGRLPTAEMFKGEEADLDDATRKATGLAALAEIDDIAIVALPDAADLDDDEQSRLAVQYLIAHAEAPGAYRIAIVDGPKSASMNKIRSFRGQFDSSYAALYHPWIETLDPNESPEQGSLPGKLLLPPSGFVAGIYARSDITRGVHKAPANEVVLGLTRFEANINTGRQQVLNPEGINALRFFPGRGNRVWGARTLSSDPEWKYVNVRRFFILLEHSIDKATQWAVFEPNGPDLWQKIVRAVEDFLDLQWRNGALLGATRAQAYFVRCDRTTMTQNDLDNGRLICLVGVAPVRPAEFVIFRIGQWTADARS